MRSRMWYRRLALVWWCALGMAAARAAAGQGSPPATAADGGTAAILRATLDAGRHPDMRWGRLSDFAGDARRLYDSTGWTTLWSRDGVPTAQARAVARVLADAGARGLRPDDYDATYLVARAADVADGGGPTLVTTRDRALYDVALTVSAMRFLWALHFGRIRPTDAHAALRIQRQPYDVAAAVLALARDATPERRVDEEEPRYLHYWLLRAALQRYRALGGDSSLRALRLTTTLRPGGQDAAVPRLRRLLLALGDLPPADSASGDSTRYDSALVAGVRRFQRRHGQRADGVVGPDTRARLGRPFDDRVRQIELTLERWRWLPRTFPVPPIVVNIPAFRLYAFNEKGDRESEILAMDVVVGRAYDRATPVFSGTMQYVVFAPYWDVPPSIARDELLPRARRDHGYLARLRMEVVRGGGDDAVVLPVTSQTLSQVEGGSARIRQRPGPWNSLGGVKFILPNAFNVYLHDTPSRSLFGETRRDFSHGCIRVAEPERLALHVLRDRPEWTGERIDSAMARARPLRVDLATPIPVLIVYGTAVARESDGVYFYDDIYGHDRALERLLAGGYPYRR
ncbi:MAG TPA: L,D-transpeptidase family protein [Gemmatimonadaceae bacterium]|nr:L,D-transpeptidase family protein [Gemmatimonadaceae bacterium]